MYLYLEQDGTVRDATLAEFVQQQLDVETRRIGLSRTTRHTISTVFVGVRMPGDMQFQTTVFESADLHGLPYDSVATVISNTYAAAKVTHEAMVKKYRRKDSALRLA